MSGPVVAVDVWLGTVKDQVAKQAKQIHENPNQDGFLAAFTSPMTIYASGKDLLYLYIQRNFQWRG